MSCPSSSTGEARLREVPEEEPRQLVRDPASIPPPVDDGHHGRVIRLPELPEPHNPVVYETGQPFAVRAMAYVVNRPYGGVRKG